MVHRCSYYVSCFNERKLYAVIYRTDKKWFYCILIHSNFSDLWTSDAISNAEWAKYKTRTTSKGAMLTTFHAAGDIKAVNLNAFLFQQGALDRTKVDTPAQCIQWAHLCCHSFRRIADLGRGSVPHARSRPRTHTWMDLVFCTRVPWKHSCPVGLGLPSVVWIVAMLASSGVGSCVRVSTGIQSSRLPLLFSCGNTSGKT